MGFKSYKLQFIKSNYSIKRTAAVANKLPNRCQLAMDGRSKSMPVWDFHGEFLKKVLNLVLKAVFSDIQREAPVSRWRSPKHLKEILNLKLPETGSADEELLLCLEDIVKYSVKTGHPHFINQLFSSVDPYGLAGQLVTDALNPSVYTYEVAPVFTLMEAEVISAMLKMVGFSEGDGIFCPGGSMANGFAVNLARHKRFPTVKKTGLCGSSQLVLFASEDAHYSIHKMAAFLGLGEDAVISVATDSVGRMDTAALQHDIERSIARGNQPFLIFATAGTTVLGSIDPLDEIAPIALKYSLWFHVDAAWGGGLLFSKKHRKLLKGISLADSVTWNPHKLLAAPQQCSTLLVRHANILSDCHNKNADYLFQKDKFYDTNFDVGDKYLQCGRRADVLKFWLMWKAKGSQGLESHVDHLMNLSQYLSEQIKQREHFVMVSEPHFVNVCFWFVPENLDLLRSHPDYYHILHKVAPNIKEGMLRRGSMMINYQPLRHWPNFFRFVAQNSAVTKEDIDFFLNEIERLGLSLSAANAP